MHRSGTKARNQEALAAKEQGKRGHGAKRHLSIIHIPQRRRPDRYNSGGCIVATNGALPLRLSHTPSVPKCKAPLNFAGQQFTPLTMICTYNMFTKYV
jgi:hypothetical protein